METLVVKNNSKPSAQTRAPRLLNWLIDFLPSTIPPSAEDAILDDSDDVHALFWHRSELENVLREDAGALNKLQKEKLLKLDKDIRAAALLLVGAGKGMLRRYREGRYDRTHWWWYLDDMLNEANLVCNQPKAPVQYAMSADKQTLSKVAEARTKYETKPRGTRK